ncbi:MAG: hypothetical protein A2Y21_02550 [Clostridiales bacterium GWC2_40_7]|nr:MAG: hypothetical protein A2Y21_02550 [Clostridiales bacterium GWC2_40_7]
MNIILNDSDKWFKVYKKLDKEKKYQYVLETMSCEIPVGFFDKLDFTGYIDHAFEYLKNIKQHEKMIELYDKAYRWKENLDGWFYCDKFLIDYYLYCNNIAGVKKHLDSFLSNPEESIDIFILVFDKLVYYGHSDLTLDISLHMFDKVKDAHGLIVGSEAEYGRIIYMEKLQSLYSDLRKNIPVHRDAVIEYLEKFEYDLESDIDRIMDALSPGYDRIPDYDDFRKDKSDFFYFLMLMFCRYMLDTKNISFSASGDIWDVALDSFKAGPPSNTSGMNFDNVFKLNKNKYDNEISGRMGLISNKHTCGCAVAWGMIYVYDFLYKHEYISDKVYNNALEVIDGIKVEIIKGYANSLWEYDFIHAWGKPDSISDEEFNVEKELFDDSFEGQIKMVDDLTFTDLIEEDNDGEEE